jgi:hypothetical protein
MTNDAGNHHWAYGRKIDIWRGQKILALIQELFAAVASRKIASVPSTEKRAPKPSFCKRL